MPLYQNDTLLFHILNMPLCQGFPTEKGNKKKRFEPQFKSLSLVGSDGFEPPKLEAADLQSAPFGHSGNYPNRNVGVDGFEPPTLCL